LKTIFSKYLTEQLIAGKAFRYYFSLHIWIQYFFSQVNIILETCPTESELAIYDLLGRVVRTFPVHCRKNSFTWDAKDENGTNVGAGIYFIRVKGSATAQIEKILLLK